MPTFLSIREAALATGLTAHTLRYYEQIGLIDPVPRRSGQRVYGEPEMAWIEFVLRLRGTGMSMRDIQVYAELRRAGETPENVRLKGDLLARHAAHMRGELQRLTETIARLDEKIALYRSFYGQSVPESPEEPPVVAIPLSPSNRRRHA
ncbi:DNA-binding transcriptional MerR regulator [Luteibacter rhizovicinus]|uniref:DNA-binding transcriptional MerR regulator n=1 Tax=Luteibacter rhizovicinus TaxID=242606 RepID=A0A4R3YMN5_9GAMM|nr:MerR family transcriptional regulator [Luteibacter rhizovicinus]TCV92364.1 DNA-binding transcriptional MerR regulator [Luteibacter rhizovicinus]